MTRSGLELDVGAIRRAGRVAARLTVLPGVSAHWPSPFSPGGSSSFLSCSRWRSGSSWPRSRRPSSSSASSTFTVGATGSPRASRASWWRRRPWTTSVGDAGLLGLHRAGGRRGEYHQKALAGPAAVVAGALWRAAGALLGATKPWDADWKPTAATLVLGLLPMFVAERLHAHGGGAIGRCSWASSARMRRRRQPAWLAAGAEREAPWTRKRTSARRSGRRTATRAGAADRLREVGKKLNAMTVSDADDARKSHLVEANIGPLGTRLAQRSLLFGAIGTELNFHRMAPAVAGRALLVVGVGLLVWIPAVYVAVHFDDRLKFREKAFVALAWLPKATAGGARVGARRGRRRPRRGEAIPTTAVLAILATAPPGASSFNASARAGSSARTRPRTTPRPRPSSRGGARPVQSGRRARRSAPAGRRHDAPRQDRGRTDQWSNPRFQNGLAIQRQAHEFGHVKRDLVAERRCSARVRLPLCPTI